MPLAGAAFVPPTSVQAVAKAAVAAATDPAVPGGIMDVWQIKEYEAWGQVKHLCSLHVQQLGVFYAAADLKCAIPF